MAHFFVDTSALARRYYQPEPGSRRVREVCAPSRRHTLLLARLATTELGSALNRKVREGALPSRERDRRWQQFLADWASQYQVVELTERIYTVADHLTFAYPLRSLDALQLACALAAVEGLARRGLTFMTADAQQARAAEREGLVIELIA